jgi:hypothetical protein
LPVQEETKEKFAGYLASGLDMPDQDVTGALPNPTRQISKA